MKYESVCKSDPYGREFPEWLFFVVLYFGQTRYEGTTGYKNSRSADRAAKRTGAMLRKL